MSHIDYCASWCVLSGILYQLIGDLGLVCDVLAADLVSTQAQRSTLSRACWALAPADWTDSICVMIAWRIAKSTALDLVFVADKRRACATRVRALGARDANINHAGWAVR